MLTSKQIMELAVKAADSKKGRDIKALYIRELSTVADYFVLCTANSPTQIKAISDEIERVLELENEAPLRVEGKRDGGWVLVDFGVVVIHIFLKEMREFYSLERLWGDAPTADIGDIITE
ncbi:MAG: ribosome silencing factor [Oscillospiraceae bacterium]|nr:ribosome silencing factor [Oscillospiraceae bacterium]